MNIGIIGAGAIANVMLGRINHDAHENLKVNSVLVRDMEKYQHLEREFGIQLYTDLDDFLASDIDIVVEAANVEVAKSVLPQVLREKDAMLISVGALADGETVAQLMQIAKTNDTALHLPSGAIGGLDLLQNAQSHGELESVKLTTRKPAAALTYERIEAEKAVFEGKAADAIQHFPKNMNVAVILAMAGIGMERTQVILIADPRTDKNTHHIEVKGVFGKASFTIENDPLPENQNTSYLAAISILGTLERMNRNFIIGG
ncbi:aspartate dehydrogenase [Salinicoccus hispanicus]|uniref:L-aspartate dehydrogenase n=1 Tax=Salinicoccus hispanicus TaxID=157225 RepID=A0A6N8TZS3_9STAP|nr:aspartate dehydrogenase [Salinicoccus hispanicus]MXQ51053.1 aspartate dehydrogenase [Salinicoccus hispanicus]